MVIDLLLVVVAVLAAVGFVLVVGRKLALISSVDLKSIPERKTTALKEQLLEQRFTRHLQDAARWCLQLLRPLARFIRARYQQAMEKLKRLEQQYALPGDQAKTNDTHLARVAQLLNEARAFVEDGLLPEAEEKCIQAISLNDREASAYRLLGDIYRQQRDYEHAREVYEFLLKLNEQDAEAHLGLGRIAADAGEFQIAAAEFSKSLELKETAAVHNDLADVYQKLGDGRRALTACQDALALEPRNPKLLDRFLTLAIEQKEAALARDALATLKTVNPDNQKLVVFTEQIENLQR